MFRGRRDAEKRRTIFSITPRKMTEDRRAKKEEKKKEKIQKKEREREEKEKKKKEKEIERERRKSTKRTKVEPMSVSSPRKIDKVKRAFNITLTEVRAHAQLRAWVTSAKLRMWFR